MTIGIIPAAGNGTRFPLPFAKELYPIIENNRIIPIIERNLEYLVSNGIKDFIIIINPSKMEIKSYFDSKKIDYKIRYIIQLEQKGLMDAIRQAHYLIPKDEYVCMLMPDTYIDDDNLVLRMSSNVKDLILGIFEREDSYRFGAVKYNKYVQRVYHKEITPYKTIWGILCYGPKFRDYIDYVVDSGIEHNENTLLDSFVIKNNKVDYIISKGKYFDLGTIEGIIEYESYRSSNTR